METIRVEDAVGTVLCHDITRIVPGKYKGPAFQKGHVVRPEDIPELIKLGKQHLYVWKPEKGMLHENDAAIRLANTLQGSGLCITEPREGKVNLISTITGMCLIDEDLLTGVNMIDEIVVATRNNRRPVQAGDIVAGLRVVPLVIDEQHLEMVESLVGGRTVVQVKPFMSFQVGIVTTGNEIHSGLIEDKFGPILKAKIEAYGCQLIGQTIVPDEAPRITEAIHKLIREGAEMILVTGGMSVDPDDVTPRAIREAGALIATYGAPVLPGAVLMAAYLDDVPILGLPGCVMYHKTTVFDLILPTILTGEKITKPMVARLGLGGLCLNCSDCHYPACSFGTGF